MENWPNISAKLYRSVTGLTSKTPKENACFSSSGWPDIDGLAAALLNEVASEPLQVTEHADYYKDRVILITGAGGSVGSEISRQLLHCAPKKIVLYESNELALHNLQLSLEIPAHEVEIVECLASVTNPKAVEHCIATHGVDIVFHAAAYKHVPLVERNPIAGIWNNVFGTKIVAETAQRLGVSTFVLISTDKAVTPNSVMGTTKRLAEMIIAEQATKQGGTQFATLRFGNILGSSGSMLPRFIEQIKQGGPVTVTDKRMQRYFITLPEAARLILTAPTLIERYDLFVFDSGSRMFVTDLLERLIDLIPLDQTDPIKVVYTGPRDGERLSERLAHPHAQYTATSHPKIQKVTEPEPICDLSKTLGLLLNAINTHDVQLARDSIMDAVAMPSKSVKSVG